MCAPPGQGPEESPTAMSEDFMVKVIGRKWKIKQKAGLGMLTICNMDVVASLHFSESEGWTITPSCTEHKL